MLLLATMILSITGDSVEADSSVRPGLPDRWHGLLHVRRERLGRRTAEKCNERAALHVEHGASLHRHPVGVPSQLPGGCPVL